MVPLPGRLGRNLGLGVRQDFERPLFEAGGDSLMRNMKARILPRPMIARLDQSGGRPMPQPVLTPQLPQISIDQQMDSPEYQSLLQRRAASGGQDQDAQRQLDAYQTKFAQQQLNNRVTPTGVVGGSSFRIPQPQPVQEFQPIQRPSVQSLQQPMGQQQPQFNQQGMQQMMQFMQQMMQMFSMMGGQGGFGGGFNQRPPMFGGGFGGGMGGGFGGGFMNQGPYGGGFGQGGYQQFQQPQQRPMPRYPRMQNNFSQSPFGRY